VGRPAVPTPRPPGSVFPAVTDQPDGTTDVAS
jgi:hypothetical protein